MGVDETRRLSAVGRDAVAELDAAPSAPADPLQDAVRLAQLDAAAEGDAARLRSWALAADELAPADARRLVASMFHTAGVVRAFSLSPTSLDAFIAGVEAGMGERVRRDLICAVCPTSHFTPPRSRSTTGATSSTLLTPGGCSWTRATSRASAAAREC
jgi:hypothetical protein